MGLHKTLATWVCSLFAVCLMVACSDDSGTTPPKDGGQKDTVSTMDTGGTKDTGSTPDTNGVSDTGTPTPDTGGDTGSTPDTGTPDTGTPDTGTPDTTTNPCATCHTTFPPTSGKHNKHRSRGMKCADCHSEVIDNQMNIISSTLHNNGTVNVKGSFTWNAGNKTCSNASGCHNTRTW
jgi:hypothetical protein